MPSNHRVYPLLAILAACILVVQCVGPIFRFSPTIDEPYHIGSAVCLYESGRATVGAQHPPLARWVAGLPLRLMGVPPDLEVTPEIMASKLVPAERESF